MSSLKRDFEVRVARPVIQYATVTVRAESEEVALAAASAAAVHVPDCDWEGSFDSEDYEAHAIGIVDRDEDGLDSEEAQLRPKYLLLLADLDVGEGELFLQPWIRRKSPLLVADVCIDWTAHIEALREQGWAEFERTLTPDVLNH